MGPTAVGKSQLGIQLAEILPCDIISVDSVMVYQGLDIGTAKPDLERLAEIPHALINIRDPANPYSAGEFLRDVQPLIQKSLKQNRIPLLVGGTLLYFHVLQQGLSELPPNAPILLQTFEHIRETAGLETLYQQLLQCDPDTAKQLHPHDAQRIQRALAVYQLTGQPFSLLKQTAKKPVLPYSLLNIAILPQNRERLKETISQRFQQMLQQGFIEEVEVLYQRKDLHANLPACRAVGYRQVLAYLARKIEYETMKTHSIIATRQLAKRQLTWLRQWPNSHHFMGEDPQLLRKVCQLIQTHYPKT
jgi:tRNA dimethylallyltransferase